MQSRDPTFVYVPRPFVTDAQTRRNEDEETRSILRLQDFLGYLDRHPTYEPGVNY
jgi:hypothetical protein